MFNFLSHALINHLQQAFDDVHARNDATRRRPAFGPRPQVTVQVRAPVAAPFTACRIGWGET
jgi:hypothetical protein